VSLLVIMGSGETAPTMVKVHRRVFEAAGPGPALLLDTPYGFQGNADDLSRRAVAYFADVAGRDVTPLQWRVPDDAAADHAVAALRGARWAFAGPGSPTYALRVWDGSGIDAEVADVVRRGGAAVFASAAALTLGSHTVPVYEVYKVGEEPVWRAGLGILERVAGIVAAVVPHWDNNEGGNHDTRFCYLGETRLERLESELPDGVGVLGVDEHTALLIDPEAGLATIDGRGTVTARYRGSERVWSSGATVSLGELAEALAGRSLSSVGGREASRTVVRDLAIPATPGAPEPTSGEAGTLREAADRALARFDEAVGARDADEATHAVLDLESAIVSWSADTEQSDDTDHARRTLRTMVVRLGELARTGAADPRERVAPFIDLLLERREAARDARDWPAADAIRDGLAANGVEVRDTPDGTQWHLPEEG
jgi:cyanophycinase-like exopeptidase